MSAMAYEIPSHDPKGAQMPITTSPSRSAQRKRSHSRASGLRLMQGEGSLRAETRGERDVIAPALCAVERPTRVLLAGADAGRRARLLDELIQTLPESTVFELADAVSEALEQAPGSRMAFITGDLDDAPAESLKHTLSQRHPGLPVLVVESDSEANSEQFVDRDRRLLAHA